MQSLQSINEQLKMKYYICTTEANAIDKYRAPQDAYRCVR